jgi:hypothetical protein
MTQSTLPLNLDTPLTAAQQRTYERIFQHPISHNLEWRDVRALLAKLGHIIEEHNGNLRVTRNGQTMVLHPGSAKDVAEMDDLMGLRHFLQRSEAAPSAAEEKAKHWLLVIDHHEARLFQSELEGAKVLHLMPDELKPFFRHGEDSKDVARGQEKPDPKTFFEPIAKALATASQILIFGTGTGTSSEMDQFIGWLKHHHPLEAQRIIGSVVVDEHHLTEGELLAKARDFYGSTLTRENGKP